MFQLGQEVTFKNAFGVNVIIEIKGNTATTFEKNTCIFYKKRLKSLKLYTKPQSQWSEQELTHPIHQHGDIVYSLLAFGGGNVMMVWDTVKQDVVPQKELSKI